MAFRDVQRQRQGAAGEEAVQSVLDQPGAVAIPGGVSVGAMPGSHGEVSKTFYDDPTVNAIVGLPSEDQANRFTGASPSFYGIQRPGDWQRTVQREMAAAALPGGQHELDAMEQNRIARARIGTVSGAT